MPSRSARTQDARNLAGFVGAWVVGFLRQTTHSFAGGLLAMAFAVLLAGVLVLIIPGLERGQNSKRETELQERSGRL